jgi:protein JBTS26
MNIQETWGDFFYVGLTGFSVFDENGDLIHLSAEQVTGNPSDMNVIPGYSGDYRTLDKLTDEENETANDKHMWLIPFTEGQNHYIWVRFNEGIKISQINFYNYNKSFEDLSRGVKRLTIKLDGKLLTPQRGITLRKGPGHAAFAFPQIIKFPYVDGWDASQITPLKKVLPPPHVLYPQEYETPYLPTGLMLQFYLINTFGDLHYIGLNGIEIFDQLGRLLTSPNSKVRYQISAVPSSVNSNYFKPLKSILGK